MAGFELVLGTPEDAKEIVFFVNAIAASDERLGIDAFPFSPEQEEAFLEIADPGLFLTLLARERETHRLLGVLTASRGSDSKLTHVSSLALAVAPDSRRQGIGQALLEGFFAWVRTLGVQKATLSVLASNPPAIALFEATGFEREAVRKGQFRLKDGLTDEILMARWFLPGA